MNKVIFTVLFLVLYVFGNAQGLSENTTQMADTFRDDGKIYVVIAVIGLIFFSIVAFLIYLERKVARLEKILRTEDKK
jgi:uncharacterized iron-regulated membrane protein